MATYLEFEEKIKKIEEDIIIAKTKSDEAAVEILNKKLEKEVEKRGEIKQDEKSNFTIVTF